MKPLAGKKVLIGPSSFADGDRTPMERLIEAGCEVVMNPFKRKLTKIELLQLLDERVVGLVAGLEPLDREVLQKSKLRVISRCGSGLSNVDTVAAGELGIAVLSTPEGPTGAVAELTLGCMLGLLRMVPQMDRNLHAGKWTKVTGFQLEGKTVAIVGFGRIGRRVAALLAPFKAKVLAVDPHPAGPAEGVSMATLEEALPQADIITLHCSGETCLLDEKTFPLIKPGAFLLNAARGGLIDEKMLLLALDEGRIAGAWLDTFEVEPYTGPLTSYPQVILTPHIGSYTRECRSRMEMEAARNLLNALAGDDD